ncbi:L-dopachrome tautomerase-related protein [Tenacibaculum sp. 190524A05c]|uniref:Major royal jelly protein n=1 Tax=Tenacibaculum platacis TaxID=3137852 RepID=A0ABM9P3X2_9FLAO
MKNLITIVVFALTIFMCKSPDKKEKKAITNKDQSVEKSDNILQIVAEFESRPGNVAVSNDGRIFTTMHPLDNSPFQLLEIVDSSKKPFPNEDYQKNGGEASDSKIDTPLGIRIDKNNVLWIIDMGQNLGKTRLFAFDISSRKEVFRFDFPEDVAPKGSFIQDLAVDEENGWVYLADIANPGILAVDTKNKTVRRFANESVQSEDIDMIINNNVINFGGAPARVAVNPITLSNDRNTLFYGAMNGTKWYSVSAELFREGKEDEEISKVIKVVGKKPISDGAATDSKGNHYFTNLQEHGIDRLTASGELKPVIRDTSIDWADNVAVSNDGWLYIVINQLYKAPAFTGAEDLGQKPYYIKKIKL